MKILYKNLIFLQILLVSMDWSYVNLIGQRERMRERMRERERERERKRKKERERERKRERESKQLLG
jgi:hypothetical protein